MRSESISLTEGSPDCVVIGHNQSDYAAWGARLHRTRKNNGGYADLQVNSVLFAGKRIDYMQLLNAAVRHGTGVDPELNVFSGGHAGATYLSSYLRRHGLHAPAIMSFDVEKEHLREIARRGPRAVAITTTFYVEADPIREIVRFVRECSPDSCIIVGGPFVFNLCEDLPREVQDYLFDSLGADVYIHDTQGEATLAAVVHALRHQPAPDLAAIPNVITRVDGAWRRASREVESNNLDDNPCDYGFIPPGSLDQCVSIRTARSCPFACSFCNYPTQAGPHVLTNLGQVESELKTLHDRGVRHLRFIDDTFNVPLPRFKHILRMMIKNRFEFQWMSFFRCSNADDEVFRLMKEAGCVGVLLGIESGDAAVLTTMNKFAKPERYEYGIEQLNKHGIVSHASLIVGFAGETEETVNTTIAFIERAAPTCFNPLLFYHDIRAPIAQRSAEFGIKGAGYSWSHNTMTWREAAGHMHQMVRSVKNSLPIPLHGFSIFAQPYLLANGLSNEQFLRFLSAARPLLIRGLDDENVQADDPDFLRLAHAMSDFVPRRKGESAACEMPPGGAVQAVTAGSRSDIPNATTQHHADESPWVPLVERPAPLVTLERRARRPS